MKDVSPQNFWTLELGSEEVCLSMDISGISTER